MCAPKKFLVAIQRNSDVELLISEFEDQEAATSEAERIALSGATAYIYRLVQKCELPPPPKPTWTSYVNGDGHALREE